MAHPRQPKQSVSLVLLACGVSDGLSQLPPPRFECYARAWRVYIADWLTEPIRFKSLRMRFARYWALTCSSHHHRVDEQHLAFYIISAYFCVVSVFICFLSFHFCFGFSLFLFLFLLQYCLRVVNAAFVTSFVIYSYMLLHSSAAQTIIMLGISVYLDVANLVFMISSFLLINRNSITRSMQ